jgi:hypothetical protein
MNESNLRNELEEVWVPKDAGELEGLLLTIQTTFFHFKSLGCAMLRLHYLDTDDL